MTLVSVDICNLALGYLGDTATVASIDPPEGSAQAQHCARFYPMAVGMMLESHDWNFITSRVFLAEVDLGDDCLYGRWQYAYAVPASANTIISVLPKSMYPQHWFSGWDDSYYWGPRFPLEFERDYRKDFQIEMMGGKQIILSNDCDAIARFTTNEVQAGQFPALFTNGLSWLLASMIAGPLLKGDAGMKQAADCLKQSQVWTEMAKSQDSNQQHNAPRPVPVWIGDR